MFNYFNNTVSIDNEEFNILDQTKFPIPDVGTLKDIFEMDLMDYRNKNFKSYNYYGLPVPRATEIIKECTNIEHLLMWAGKVGLRSYMSTRENALNVGERVHSHIENYLTTGQDPNFDEASTNLSFIAPRIKKAYNNFKSWIERVHKLGCNIEIIGIEIPVVCPYYGGTIDCIARINGKVYILDFKTSKQLSYDYLLQVCSYMWIVNNGYVPNLPHIDGVGLIRIDKETENKFEDYFLNYHIPFQREIIEHYYRGFASYLSCFYNTISMKQEFTRYKKMYRIGETLKG